VSGEPTAVIVPIELWREVESQRETAFLLKSERMKDRLLQAAQRQTGRRRSILESAREIYAGQAGRVPIR
jgi:hypothetical protein